jgi:xanthine dehydrogenase YagR molybdenum-binding subunit
MSIVTQPFVGAPVKRIEGPAKVTGAATYAAEYQLGDIAYAAVLQSTIARGTIVSIDSRAALALPGVLCVLTHENAPRLNPVDEELQFPIDELLVLQNPRVAFHGQFIAAAVAETAEIAQHAASLVDVRYEQQPHDVLMPRDGRGLDTPFELFPKWVFGESDTVDGDVDAALRDSAFTIDETYTTGRQHHNPLEPHATIAVARADGITLYDASQAPMWLRDGVARAFGIPSAQVHVVCHHIGGGFGCKILHAGVLIAIMASQELQRPVKLALTRRQMFAVAGYRSPTSQRVRLGTNREGRLQAIVHDAVVQTSRYHEHAEAAASATRTMYASPTRSTSHRIARLDLPAPWTMRAPGIAPGMFALESAMDEMAYACGMDPIDFRIANEPEVDPETGDPFSSRNLIACLTEGAERFGWAARRSRNEADGVVRTGMGVASSIFHALQCPSNAIVRLEPDGEVVVKVAAIDFGTGARTVLAQIAADAMEVPVERVRVEIGDSSLPDAPPAGGSWGTASWGSAILDAARKLRVRLGDDHDGVVPPDGLEVLGETGFNELAERLSMHSFGAQFAEVRVDLATGEIRVPRMLGVFAAGRIINPITARSQMIGGMTMGLSTALHEETVVDQQLGAYTNPDLASYHIATNADIGEIDVAWVTDEDPHVNRLGAKGIGELGVIATTAAIANAVHDATGVRVRDLPITPDRLIGRVPAGSLNAGRP